MVISYIQGELCHKFHFYSLCDKCIIIMEALIEAMLNNVSPSSLFELVYFFFDITWFSDNFQW